MSLNNEKIEDVLKDFAGFMEKSKKSQVVRTKKGYFFIRFTVNIFVGHCIESIVKITESEQLISEIKSQMKVEDEKEMEKINVLTNSAATNIENVIKAFHDILEQDNCYEVIETKKGYFVLKYENHEVYEDEKIKTAEDLLKIIKEEMEFYYSEKWGGKDDFTPEETLKIQEIYNERYNRYILLSNQSNEN